MAEPILIMGKSSTGKSTSLRNLPPNQTIILTPNAKSMPWKGGDAAYERGKNMFVTNQISNGSKDAKFPMETVGLKQIIRAVAEQAPHVRYLVVEDFTHFFSARIFDKSFLNRKTGSEAFQRYTEFAADVHDAIFKDLQNLRKDLYLILIAHTDVDDQGYHAFKAPGKLLTEKIDVPSYFTYIFHSMTKEDPKGVHYVFQTNKDSIFHAKSPMGAFSQLHVPNDLKPILDAVDEYRGIVPQAQQPQAEQPQAAAQ
jgi:hypothetical protein